MSRLRFFNFLILAAFVLVTVAFWQIRASPTQASNGNVGLYGLWEIQVTNSENYSNPFDFNEIELQAAFTAPSGKQIDFWGFYDGNGAGGQEGNVWKIRFMPDETGSWSYAYSWSDGTPGDSGSFQATDTGLLGPLKVATDNSWYFTTARNTPIDFRGYKLGCFDNDLGWWWGTTPFNDKIERYLECIDDYAFPSSHNNHYHYNVVMATPPGCSYNRSTGEDWEHSWWFYNGSSTDIRRFEIKTWYNWDRVLKKFYDRKVYTFPFALIGRRDLENRINTRAKREHFLRYYLARYGAYWNLFGHSLVWEWSKWITTSEAKNWLEDFQRLDPFGNLFSIHDTSVAQFEGLADFTMRQNHHRDIFGEIEPDDNCRTCGRHGGSASVFRNQPIIGSEDIWEESGLRGQPRDKTEVRRGAWGIMLAGVMPLYAESNDHGCPEDGCNQGEGEAEVQRMFDWWYSTLNRYRQYQKLNHLVSQTERQIASGIPGEEYLVYDENGGSITIDLSGTSTSDDFSVLWYNPANGNENHGTTIGGGASQTLSSPFPQDTVLLLRKTGTPPPTLKQVLLDWLGSAFDQNGDEKVNSLDFAQLLPLQ